MNIHAVDCSSCTETLSFPILPDVIVASHTRRHHGGHDGHDGHDGSDLSTTQPGGTQVSANRCPRCQQQVIEYRFMTADGFSIATYHCARHGDVVPMHSFLS